MPAAQQCQQTTAVDWVGGGGGGGGGGRGPTRFWLFGSVFFVGLRERTRRGTGRGAGGARGPGGGGGRGRGAAGGGGGGGGGRVWSAHHTLLVLLHSVLLMAATTDKAWTLQELQCTDTFCK